MHVTQLTLKLVFISVQINMNVHKTIVYMFIIYYQSKFVVCKRVIFLVSGWCSTVHRCLLLVSPLVNYPNICWWRDDNMTPPVSGSGSLMKTNLQAVRHTGTRGSLTDESQPGTISRSLTSHKQNICRPDAGKLVWGASVTSHQIWLKISG